MAYRERLHFWIVVRLLPDMQHIILGRFRRRVDAEGHLQFLQQKIPEGKYVVMFDERSDSG